MGGEKFDLVPPVIPQVDLTGLHRGLAKWQIFSDWDGAYDTCQDWGEVRYNSGVTPTDYTLRHAQDIAYTGQYSYTADFGLMFYREASRSDSEVDNARWYDSALGRFAQADTIVPSGIQGWDRYAYVNNSPVMYTDPSGHNPECGPDGVFCDNNYWNDFYYLGGLTNKGKIIAAIGSELERLTNEQVTLRMVIRLIFEREYNGWGSSSGRELPGISDIFVEASGRGYWAWSEYMFGFHSDVTLLNWLGEHNHSANSVYRDIFENIPAGKKSLNMLIGPERNYYFNAGVGNQVASGLLNMPEEWKTFDGDAPYSFAFCDVSACMIHSSRRLDFEKLPQTDLGANHIYIFSTDIASVYFKHGSSYIATFNQIQYWSSPKP